MLKVMFRERHTSPEENETAGFIAGSTTERAQLASGGQPLAVRGLGGERVPVRSQPGDWQLSPASPPVFPQETEQLLGLPVSLQGTAELQAAWEFV